MAVLAFLSLLWGGSFVLMRIATSEFTALDISTWRVTFAASALIPVMAIMHLSLPRARSTWGKLVALSVLGQAVPFTFLGGGAHLTTSGNLALMMSLVPFFTFAIGNVVTKEEKWRLHRLSGLALGFLGVSIAILGSPVTTFMRDLTGSGYALLAAISFAAGNVVSRKVLDDVDPIVTTGTSLGLSAITLHIVTYTFQSSAASGSYRGWAALAALGIINTAIAYVVFFWLVRRVGPTLASFNNYLVPIVGLLLGHIVLSEPLSLSAFTGLLLVITGIALFSRPTHPAASGADAK